MTEQPQTSSLDAWWRRVSDGSPRQWFSRLWRIGHRSMALLGVAVVAMALLVVARSEFGQSVESRALDWLQAREEATEVPVESPTVDPVAVAVVVAEPDPVSRATATDPGELTRQQATVARWIARRYRVAPEPISRLVKEAWSLGQGSGLDPMLILAVIAIESSFNPFAQSSMGAQGLMQVMTRVHNDKFERFGGALATFDPVTNLAVGVQVLKDCIARAGTVKAGLRCYVGAANLESDGGYSSKVLAEQRYLKDVFAGRPVPTNVSFVAASSARPLVPRVEQADSGEAAGGDDQTQERSVTVSP